MAKTKKTEKVDLPSLANNFNVVEAYKTLRANVLFSLASVPEKTIMVSSAEPDVGKSTTCANLAVILAQAGNRVLLVDADLRKPTLHKTFQKSKSGGLTRYLINLCDWKDCVLQEVAPGVDLIPSGPIPPNPSELLGSSRMVRFMEQVSKVYDYVILDTPPLNVVTDGMILASRVAGTVMVCRQNVTGYDELQDAIENVKTVNGTVLGVVINDYRYASGERKRYRYYKRYGGYGYGYGYGYGKSSEN